jgi:hypothetical protein
MGIIQSVYNNFSTNEMTSEEKVEFWKSLNDEIEQRKSRYSPNDAYENSQKKRIEDAQNLVNNEQFKTLFEKHHTYLKNVRKMSTIELIGEIQPRWRKRHFNFFSTTDAELVTVAMMEYRLRGCDIEYFSSGFGAD